MQYRVYDIDYDTDGASVDLPREMLVELDDGADPSTDLADKVSDETGWCVLRLRFEDATPAPGP